MAYSTLSSAPRPFVLVPRFASGWSTGMLAYGSAVWGYTSTADAVAAVVASSFFSDGYTLGMRKWDMMAFMDVGSTGLLSWLTVTAVTSAGNDPRGATVTSLLTT
jgi:hypothetical protein